MTKQKNAMPTCLKLLSDKILLIDSKLPHKLCKFGLRVFGKIERVGGKIEI